ncbi:hypothetical protein [Planctomycetes bacterium K23_9]|uniref:Competence protein A n=1 Tax=Stieleria marina TaxID=1930275 RepID=A0A517NS93_9BACT|nr:hypothetical protein K239x_19610 [Planctomycetes bacterium K23_9]
MSSANSSSAITKRLDRLRSALSQAPASFVGIDIGVRQITVTSIGTGNEKARRKSDRKSALKWQSIVRIPLPVDPISTPSRQWIQQTIDTLVQKLPRTVDGQRIVTSLSLPTTWMHYQVTTANNLENCQSQCDELFQNSIFNSNAHLAHWPMKLADAETEPTTPVDNQPPTQDALQVVASTSNSAAIKIAQTINSLGYQVHSLLPHGAALVHSAHALTSIAPQSVAMLNFDGGLVAMNRQADDRSAECGLCRSLPALPHETLQQLQDSEPSNGLSLNDIYPWLSDIAAEIVATTQYSQRGSTTVNHPEILLVCGDIATISGVDSALAKLTNLPVAVWRYCGRSRPYQGTKTHAIGSDGTCAMSLSLAHQAAMSTQASEANAAEASS